MPPNNYINNQDSKKVFEQNGYKFFIPSFFQKMEQVGAYQGEDDKKQVFKVQVRISKRIPLDFMSKMGEKADL